MMRVKPLRFLRCTSCTNFGKGIAAIMYNLSFSPALESIDLSRCTFTDHEIKELSVSTMKLLKMNTSIKTLLFNNCSKNTNPKFNKEFWMALGDNSSLEFLDFSFSGKLVDMENLGHGIAFNAKRKGALKYLLMEEAICSTTFKQLYNGLSVSPYD